MRVAHAMPLAALLFAVSSFARSTAPEIIAGPNDNRGAAGTLTDGVLTVALEAKLARWYPDGDSLPGAAVAAFAEVGKGPTVPGPLIRVPRGTVIAATILNSLADTLTFHVPAAIHGVTSGMIMDSVVVPPGERRELRTSATTAGEYIYRALHGDVDSRRFSITGQLTGAIVVDADARPRPDRVMVITLISDSITPGLVPAGRPLFAINGRSWPHTERISATVGDSVRWRVLNASQDIHPMHLHGFYFRVDRFRAASPISDRDNDGRMAVTQAMPPFSTLSMTWVPERAGNWLFHCHFQIHLLKADALHLAPATGPVAQQSHPADHSNHALTAMSGLVMGIHVAPRPGSRATVLDAPRRRLRLLVVKDPGFPDSTPSMRFIIEERGKRTEERPGFSPTLNLLKDQPVSITVVNQLAEATSVHWHGMELESYFDGVAGLSGEPKRLAPMIAPKDSFEARFTPPRAGTFLYHSHVDEVATHRAGLLGAMIVREGSLTPPADEHIFFIKATRTPGTGVPIEINGQLNPDTVVVRAGRVTRIRVLALTIVNPGVWVQVTSRRDSLPVLQRDSLAVPLRIVAKDGAELPESQKRVVTLRPIISMGETYDYEISPTQQGVMQFEVRAGGAGVGNARLLSRVAIIVR